MVVIIYFLSYLKFACAFVIRLWRNFMSGAFAKLLSAYVKCVKIFLDIHCPGMLQSRYPFM